MRRVVGEMSRTAAGKKKGGAASAAAAALQNAQGATAAQVLLPACIGTTKEGNVKLTVHVKPNAKRSAVTDLSGESVGVALAAPPRDGEANAELVDFMSEVLEAKKKQVELMSGAKSRDKVLVIMSMTPEQVHDKLQRHLAADV